MTDSQSGQVESDFSKVLQVKSRLRSIESMSLEMQRKMQETQLRDLFRHAYQYSDWWRTRLSKAGYHQDEKAFFTVLEKIPPLLRTDLQEYFEAMRAWQVDWTEKDIATSTTSGSTGYPVRVEKYKDVYGVIYAALALVDHEWHGRDSRLPMASLTGKEDGLYADWGPLFAFLQGRGYMMKRSLSNRTSEEHAAWLMEHRPSYLMCTSLRATEIGNSILQQGKTLTLHHIISQSERVTPYQREACRKAFGGAKIIDRYSCEEAGWLALQCPKHDHLHVMSGTAIIEIVDDELKPCPVGVAGRVLVTSLHSYAMPIIRYDIGDIAEWGEVCDCGIKLPVIGRLWGRKRNLVVLPNGESRPMTFFGDEVAEIPVIKEYRIIQQVNGTIDFFVRAERVLTEEECDKLRSCISRIDSELVVNICEVSFIDWGTGLKREEFIRLGA